MKITVEISEDEYFGLRAYLEELEGRPCNKQDVRIHIQGVVTTTINSDREASSHYINEVREKG